MEQNPYIDYQRLESAQRVLERQDNLELLRAEVADEMIDRLLGEENTESERISVERTKLATCFISGILKYEKRRMALNLGQKKEVEEIF